MTFEKEILKKVSLDYLLYLPDDYDKKDEWPLILFLHGAGEVGDNLAYLKTQGLPKYLETNSLDAIVVSPQCPRNTNWGMLMDELYELLKSIKASYKVNLNKVYLTGLSMGGYGTWTLAVKHPKEFAALVPICGGMVHKNSVEILKDMPVWVFHGAKDNVVPLEASKRLVDVLEECGGNVKFTVYPDLRHDSWTRTYNNPELYEWLFNQSK
ncbi:phospholipase [Acidaminobacter sp. JC074]|nr:phospholipase [Acidaminobacter sp. JC074]